MSQEKIKDILINIRVRLFDEDTASDKILSEALAEINKIVMECLPKKKETAPKSNSFYFLGGRRGFNKAIAEFKANWEGK